MLQKLDDQNTKLSDEIKHYEEENKLLNEKIEKIKIKEYELEKEYDSFINKAKKEANKILEKAKEDALELIKTLEDKKNNLEIKEHEVAEFKNLARNLGIKNEETLETFEIKVGDQVFVKGWQRNGEVVKIAKDKYEVKVGNFQVSFTKNELGLPKKVNETKPKTVRKPVQTEANKSAAKLECDLRGFRYEEVKDELDRFIDRAYLAGLNQIYIIHGFGTGAVRKAVYEYLNKCPYIKSTRFGGEGEGLNGVTVAYLK